MGIKKGLTIVEMVIALAASGVIILGLAYVVADTQSRWEKMYERVNGEVVMDFYAAKRSFESAVRESSLSMKPPIVSNDGSSIMLFSYKDISSNRIDSYARFYVDNGSLIVDYGPLVEDQELSSWLIVSQDYREAFLQASLSLTGSDSYMSESDTAILSEDAVNQLEEAAFAKLLTGEADGGFSETEYTRVGREVLARDVEAVSFSVEGATVRMILTMERGGKARQLYCSAVRRSG